MRPRTGTELRQGVIEMPQVVATGPNPAEKLEFELVVGETVRFGRKSLAGWSIPWDKQISREHGDLFETKTKITTLAIKTTKMKITR